MTKKMIYVPVGAVPRLSKYSTGGEYISYDSTYLSALSINCNTLDDLIERLTSIRATYGSEYSDLTIESKRDCGCWGDCQCSPSYYVQGKRLETDLEYDLRTKSEAEAKARREENDRRAYEELKKKFGE